MKTKNNIEDLKTVVPICMYKVLRKADGTIKTRLVRRCSRFSIAYNSLKDHAEMAREKGINVQKIGAQYFVINPSFGAGVVLMLYVCRGEIDEKKAARIINKALPQLQTADSATDAPKADNEPKDAPTADVDALEKQYKALEFERVAAVKKLQTLRANNGPQDERHAAALAVLHIKGKQRAIDEQLKAMGA